MSKIPENVIAAVRQIGASYEALAVALAEVEITAPKATRTRRTKAQIEADEKAAAEADEKAQAEAAAEAGKVADEIAKTEDTGRNEDGTVDQKQTGEGGTTSPDDLRAALKTKKAEMVKQTGDPEWSIAPLLEIMKKVGGADKVAEIPADKLGVVRMAIESYGTGQAEPAPSEPAEEPMKEEALRDVLNKARETLFNAAGGASEGASDEDIKKAKSAAATPLKGVMSGIAGTDMLSKVDPKHYRAIAQAVEKFVEEKAKESEDFG